MIIGSIALLNLVLHLIAIKGYGYFRDELYYIACSDHLAFGYVDQPPLSIIVIKAIRFLFGDSLIALRILPVLSGAVLIFLTGLMARKLGGRTFPLLLASAAAFAPIGNYFFFSIYSMNFLDIIFWQACILIVIHIIKTDNPKYWLLFGLVAGLGLQNKISVLFLIFGLCVGILLTNQRKHLKSPHFWIGMILAGLLFLPYVIWNIVNDWPMLEFIHNARTYKMSDVSPLSFFVGQFLYNNPVTFIVWLAGLAYFLFSKGGKTYRIFGWMFVSIYILFTIQEAKDYYLAAGYPILFAGGAVQFEAWLRKGSLRWLKPILIVLIIISTLFFIPYTLAILPVEDTIAHIRRIGIEPNPGERHEMGALPQHFADMHGWEEIATTMADVYHTLTPEEQSQCIIYVRNYGEAGAIDFFGEKYGLPKATCAHNNYWFWGPPADRTGDVMIVFGASRDIQTSYEDLLQHFETVEHAATTECQYCMPYENNRPIFICRNMHSSIQEIWEEEKHFN
jgi:hypothetical protein